MKKYSSFFLFIIKYSGDNMSKDTFKIFAGKHPELAESVLKSKTTWQKLYELYDIYGENSTVWDNFFTSQPAKEPLKELFQTFKNLDMEQVQKGVTSLQKTIGLLQDIGLNNNDLVRPQYEPKPLYTYFDD